ncbi:MAG TPA: type II secretion system protein [Phycisphaerae bacterium]|nr:type II secretion system protein [Phycisphaerae bacterium]
MRCHGHRGGFTLVELLVVIAIICVLVSILVPVLRDARDQTLKAVCLSQLRGVGIGLHAYARDWNMYLPWSHGTDGTVLAGSTGTPCRLGLLYVTGEDAKKQLTSLPYHCESGGYIANRDMLDCPSKDYRLWPYSQGYWRKVMSGMSYCVPVSAFLSGSKFCYRLDDERAAWPWPKDVPYRALVGCYREDGQYPANVPHRNKCINAVYKGGSASSVPRPEKGWGTYSWLPDVPENEIGNRYEGSGFWMIANGRER